MPKHTDRGLIVVRDEADGTTSLAICSKVVNGQPVNVYAEYHHADVRFDHDVRLTRAKDARYTDEIVEVYSRGTVVNVRYPQYD